MPWNSFKRQIIPFIDTMSAVDQKIFQQSLQTMQEITLIYINQPNLIKSSTQNVNLKMGSISQKQVPISGIFRVLIQIAIFSNIDQYQ